MQQGLPMLLSWGPKIWHRPHVNTTTATNLKAVCNITESETEIGNMLIDEDIDSEDEWEKDGDDIDNTQRILAFDDEANL